MLSCYLPQGVLYLCAKYSSIWCYNYIQKFYSLAITENPLDTYTFFFPLGILCGTCENGGVSVLFDRCVSCSNAFITLVPLLGKLQWTFHSPWLYYHDVLLLQCSCSSSGSVYHHSPYRQAVLVHSLPFHFLCAGKCISVYVWRLVSYVTIFTGLGHSFHWVLFSWNISEYWTIRK